MPDNVKTFKPLWVKTETHDAASELALLTGRNKSRAVHAAVEAALRLARANAARRAPLTEAAEAVGKAA